MGELKAVMLPHIRERENQDKIKIGFPFLITNLKQPENNYYYQASTEITDQHHQFWSVQNDYFRDNIIIKVFNNPFKLIFAE